MREECKYPENSRSYRFCVGCNDAKSCKLSTSVAKQKDKCIVLEAESACMFSDMMNSYLLSGYKIASSSCNSKYYKAILILDESEEVGDIFEDNLK